MKHKHNFQFVEKIEGTYIPGEVKFIDSPPFPGMFVDSDSSDGIWTKTRFRFVCICGKTKEVYEK